MIDISKHEKTKVLQALFDASKAQGSSWLHYDPEPLSTEEAAAALAVSLKFDYFKGRVLKIDLSGNMLDPRLYDRDNGPGAAQRAIDGIR